jgi:copper transport protein
VAVAAVLTSLALAEAAFAHSMLIATEPFQGAVVERTPERVLLRFDEPVEAGLVSIEVFDGTTDEVTTRELDKPKPEEAAIAIPDPLADGTYTVVWRVISADSDPISGAWVFHVGAPGPRPAGVADEVLESTPFVVSALHLGGRFAALLLLLLCVGGAAALVTSLVGASHELRRKLLGLLVVLAPALAIVALLGLPLQGAVASGSGLGPALAPDMVSSVAETRYGQFSLAQMLLALALAAVALRARRPGGWAGGAVLAVAIALALIFTPGLSGHARVAGLGSVIADAAHVQAASIWVGGLAFVAIALLLAREKRWSLAASSVPRFSTLAVVSVCVLLLAGAINGYLQVRTWRGLWETEYGRLLLIKVALVVPLLALGAYNNRQVVPRLRAQIASAGERRRFMRFAAAELAIMVAIVGITAGLVNAPPARTDLAADEPPAMEGMPRSPAMEGKPP